MLYLLGWLSLVLTLGALPSWTHAAVTEAAPAYTRTITPLDDVTVGAVATLVAARDNTRDLVNCTNNSATVAVRWGSSAVTAAKGQRVTAGVSITIYTKEPVYMISEGADVVVSCTKEAY